MLNIAVIMILVRWLYYSKTRRKDYLFTYILISSIVFLLCFLLESVKLQIGFALGMFAIFGIIRYRTDALPIKEMTYLFLIIGVSVINALTNTETSLVDLLFSNFVIIFITYGLEKVWLLKHESSKLIIYEKINLIKEENYEELLKDLQERTGIKKINRVEVGKINFLRDICDLTIYYYTDKINKGHVQIKIIQEMMRMTTKKLVLLFLLICTTSISFSQDDFGIWYSISAEKKLVKNLELDLDANVRTYDNASKIEEAFFDIGLTYKFNKYLSAAASYRFTEFKEDDDQFHPRHKWFADLKGKLPIGDFDYICPVEISATLQNIF